MSSKAVGDVDTIVETVGLISKKWHPAIIRQLGINGPERFNEIKRGLHGISGKVLAESLDDLVDKMILERTVIKESPLQVEYSLTETGQNLDGVLNSLAEWGSEYLDAETKPTVLIVHSNPRIGRMYEDWLSTDYTCRVAYSDTSITRSLTKEVELVIVEDGIVSSIESILERIRKLNGNCKILLVSTSPLNLDIIEREIDAHLTEPIPRDKFCLTIDELYDRSNYNDTIQEYLALLGKLTVLRKYRTSVDNTFESRVAQLEKRIQRLEGEIDSTEISPIFPHNNCKNQYGPA